MGRGEADWSGMYLSSRSDPFRSDHSLGVVSFGVVGLISSLPSCAFPPVVLLSHPAFLSPLVFIRLITSSCSLTSPRLNWLVPLACCPTRFWHVFFPLTFNPNSFDPCIYRGPRGYLDAHSQPHLPLLDSPFICHCYLLQCFLTCSFLFF